MALISKTHTRNLISQSLWEKLRLLGSPLYLHTERRAPYHQLALWPSEAVPINATPVHPTGPIVNEELEAGYLPAVPKEMIVQMVRTWASTFEGATLPAAFSLWMYVSYNNIVTVIRGFHGCFLYVFRIRLFLPFRVHFHFSGNPQRVLLALNRSPEDPQSLHPALLNAMYLAACWIVGQDLDFLKEYFLAQTRYHMGEALKTADRLIHFLWASCILGTFFALENRMNEAYVTVSSCVELALACGLDVVHYRHTIKPVQDPLLPPPVDATESIDRAALSRVLYMLDRTLAVIFGTPSAFSGARGPFARPAFDDGNNAVKTEVR